MKIAGHLILSLLTFTALQAGAGDLKIPARDPSAGPELIDLSSYYNAALTETWHPASNMAGDTGNDLSELPRGVYELKGVKFDLRGLIQLSRTEGQSATHAFPEAVKGMKVGMPCQKLHFLQGAGFVDREGAQIAAYIIHYSDGGVTNVAIVYGEHVRDWWAYPQQAKETKHATVAWTGQNQATKANGLNLQLFRFTWDNPRPEVAIESIDFRVLPARSIPFLVAITAEPASSPAEGH